MIAMLTGRVFLGFWLALFFVSTSSARTFFVTQTNDAAKIVSPNFQNYTLREAVMAANMLGGTNTIILGSALNESINGAHPWICHLTITGANETNALTGDLNITKGNLTISGVNSNVCIDATILGDRVFQISSNANVTLQNLVIYGGTAPNNNDANGPNGGAIYNAGSLALRNCVISNNFSGSPSVGQAIGDGGGIYNSGNLSLSNCLIVGNFAGTLSGNGGGIQNDGVCSIINSTITGNQGGAVGFSGGEDIFFDGGNGGGIFNNGYLVILGCTIRNNFSGSGVIGLQQLLPILGAPGNPGGSGGGIYNLGSLLMDFSTVCGNISGNGGSGLGGIPAGIGGMGGNGAGIFNGSFLSLSNSTISGNICGNGGAGGNGYYGTAAIGGAGGMGGGIWNTGTVSLVSCTIALNQTGQGGNAGNGDGEYYNYSTNIPGPIGGAGGSGGGIFNGMSATNAIIRNCLIALNSVTNGGAGGTDTLYNGSPIPPQSGNPGTNGIGLDVAGDFVSHGFNLIGQGDGSTGFTNAILCDQVGSMARPIDPLIGPLQANGGPTPTHGLLWGSPALDQGYSFGITKDQRGHVRPRDYSFIPNAVGGDGSDIGAFELDAVLLTPLMVYTNGLGRITPNDNGVLLAIDSNYSLTATPALGFVFANWTDGGGNILTNRPTLKFVMESNLVLVANFVDVQKPILSIITPTANQHWSNSIFNLSCKATDNFAVSNVFYNLNDTGWNKAALETLQFSTSHPKIVSMRGMTAQTNLPTNPPIPTAAVVNSNIWNATLILSVGTNRVSAYATDLAGNFSATNTVSFVYVLSAPLTVGTSGRGTVSPNDNNLSLQIGKRYTLTATPSAGFGFTNWTDGDDNVVTNNHVLSFVMASNLVFTANFVDVQKPTVTILSPTAATSPTGEYFTATGKATDNVGVTTVQCQLNGGALFTPAPAGPGNFTNWSVTLDLVPGTNYFSAFAADAAGNVSATNTVKFLYTTAPGSLNGLIGGIAPVSTLPVANAISVGGNNPSQYAAFGLATFSEWAADTNNGDNAVGSYTYTKQSPRGGQLKINYTAPPSATNAEGAQTIQLTFTAPGVATFTNLTTTDTGGITFTSTPTLAISSLAGQTVYGVDSQGNAGLIHFTASQATQVSLQSGTNGLKNYTYKVYSPVGGLVKETGTNGAGYTVVTFLAANNGLTYSESYDATGTNLNGLDQNIFGLALQRAGGNAPTNLVNRTVVVTTDGITGQLNFTDTVNFTDINPFDNSVTNGYGTYLYSYSTNTANLGLSYFSPPQTVGFNLFFVSPNFAIFTNTADSTFGAAVLK